MYMFIRNEAFPDSLEPQGVKISGNTPGGHYSIKIIQKIFFTNFEMKVLKGNLLTNNNSMFVPV